MYASRTLLSRSRLNGAKLTFLPSKRFTTKMAGEIKAVIFDIDGTLIDSNDAHARAFQQAFKETGRDLPYDDVRRLIGMGSDNLIPSLTDIEPDSSEAESVNAKKKEYFERELPSIESQPKSKELIENLHQRGFRIAIASSCKSSELDKFLNIIKINKDMLDVCVTSDDIDSSKPDPDVMHVTLSKLHMEPDEVIMIGDTPFDAESAGKAGVGTIALLCGGFWSEKDFPRNKGIFKDPEDLLQRIGDSPLGKSPQPS